MPWWVPMVPQFHIPLPRAAKQRRKGDRLVIACQEQMYWLVNRPPVSPSWGEGLVPWAATGQPRNYCVCLKRSVRSCGKDVSFVVSPGDRTF